MSSKNVLITDAVHPSLLTGLDLLGYAATYAPAMSRAEMYAVLSHYESVVINTRCGIDRAGMEAAPHLKWIARLGSGLDILDLVAAKELNIAIFSAPEGNAQAVAEHALGMLLALTNRILPADQSVRSGEWLREANRGTEIRGKTIGIIGYGHNGSAFARLLRHWDVQVLVYDKYKSGFGDDRIRESAIDEVCTQSDILSLHIPLTEETRNMVDDIFLENVKPGCILINTSRGKVVDLPALVRALKNHKIRGACLDVFPAEPPMKGIERDVTAFQQLCTMDHVVMTPHVAGWTVESKQKIADVLLERIRSFGKK